MPAGLPIVLYNVAVMALVVHVASDWWPALRVAYLGLLMGAAVSVVTGVVRAGELAGTARGPALREEVQVQAITLGAAVAYGAAGYLLYRSYRAHFLDEDAGLRHVPSLVLIAIVIASALAIGWIARTIARDRAADLGG